MPTLLKRTATAPAAGPVAVPLVNLFPGRRSSLVLSVVIAAAAAVTVTRPGRVPAPVQRAADVVTGTVVAVHPLETVFVRRRLARYDVTARTRRATVLSTALFGVFGAVPAMRAVRRATR